MNHTKQPIFEQFFDFENDPVEEKNLIHESDLQEEIDRFRKKCENHSDNLVVMSKKYSLSKGF